MWCEAVRWRERGELGARRFETAARARRTASLALSNRKEFTTPHNGAINSLQRRYLLSGASDGSAAIFDVQNATEYEAGFIAKHRSILLVDKQHENGHKFVVSMAVWYPVDTGLFVTASFDQYVKVWDTNSTQVVMDFKMPGKVYSAAMSPIATTHMLIATGSADVQVHLCDIASGAFTHTLSGHRDGIMSLEWSTSSEWILMSGGCDGAIRFWDIRRAGCFLVLDQSRSQLGRQPPFLEGTSDKIWCYGSFELFTTFIFFKDLLCTAEDRQDKPLQLAVTEDPSLVFIPCMASIKAYNLWSGMTFQTFRGHYEPVNCCYCSAQEQELYTGSNDMQILVWSSTPAGATFITTVQYFILQFHPKYHFDKDS
uniref:Uncharacterized protein n=1 Tax=Oryza barthii TaxID=65489 RepID=A0A0D3EWH3_9ORYZ